MTERQRFQRKAILKIWGIMGVINMRAGLSPDGNPVKWLPGSDQNPSPLHCK